MARAHITIEYRLNTWFYILRDLGETHPDNLHLFGGFVVGKVGSEDIIYGKGKRNSKTD